MNVLSVAVAITVGVVVLVGYFFPVPVLSGLRVTLVQWAMLLAAVAVFLGVFNLLSVHMEKIRRRQKGAIYGGVLVVSLLVTFLAGLVLGPEHALMRVLFDGVIFPVEASLMAVLAVTLLYAGARLLRHRSDWMAVAFLGTALFLLVTAAPLPGMGEIPILGDLVRPFVTQVLATAGARGILLGVALGTLTTGLRVLIGSDRPYGEK
ncbi:MAG: hypothetical protein D6770_11325 [Anaerolineae bacterium]|nr:MAG: hypothetical protein D6770_11325 [Anaerolineae bacterium]